MYTITTNGKGDSSSIRMRKKNFSRRKTNKSLLSPRSERKKRQPKGVSKETSKQPTIKSAGAWLNCSIERIYWTAQATELYNYRAKLRVESKSRIETREISQIIKHQLLRRISNRQPSFNFNASTAPRPPFRLPSAYLEGLRQSMLIKSTSLSFSLVS